MSTVNEAGRGGTGPGDAVSGGAGVLRSAGAVPGPGRARIPREGLPRIVAHRGLHAEASGGARENTLAAIAAALAAGIGWVEVDVRLTRDGEVVLLHDPDLARLWGIPRLVADVDLAEVRALGGSDRRIPLLADALELVRGTGTVLLIDMDGPRPAVPAVEVVRACGAEGFVAWCGHREAMAAIRDALPEAEIWMPWAEAEPPSAADLVALAPRVVNAPHLIVGRAFVEAVHALGCEVSAWTVDEPAQAVWLGEIGADSLTTNVPARLSFAGAADERARRRGIVAALAEQASEATWSARRDGFGPVLEKSSPSDHVTAVDRGIEQQVRGVLRAQFPDHDIVGEEYGGTTDGARSCWFIDPIDGTANLANGVPWTSFSLALAEGGQPVVAAVLDPVGSGRDGVPLPVPVVGAAGEGAWRGGVRLRVSPREGEDPLRGAVVVMELAGAVAWPGMHALMDALAARHCTLRIPGSGTATLAGIALGRGTAAMVHRFSPVDHAAAVLIVAEAGGAVLDADGEDTLFPGSGPVFVGADRRTARALRDAWSACLPRP